MLDERKFAQGFGALRLIRYTVTCQPLDELTYAYLKILEVCV